MFFPFKQNLLRKFLLKKGSSAFKVFDHHHHHENIQFTVLTVRQGVEGCKVYELDMTIFAYCLHVCWPKRQKNYVCCLSLLFFLIYFSFWGHADKSMLDQRMQINQILNAVEYKKSIGCNQSIYLFTDVKALYVLLKIDTINF